MIGTHLDDEEIQCIVDKTIEKMDMDDDGCIDLEEFESVNCNALTIMHALGIKGSRCQWQDDH